MVVTHNIDLMHQERNVAKSIISMRFDVTGFSKDNVNVRKDLAGLCNCPSMEPVTPYFSKKIVFYNLYT
jgi:hypothetical protein